MLENIGLAKKKREKGFRNYYNFIFSKENKEKRKNVVEQFRIFHTQKPIDQVNALFAPFVGHIPNDNRVAYISTLLGLILAKVTAPPHKWIVTRQEFEAMLQSANASYARSNIVPLPQDFQALEPSIDEMHSLSSKRFIEEIRNIGYDAAIPTAITDYWKAQGTIIRYFKDNFVYNRDLPAYRDDLLRRLKSTKSPRLRRIKGLDAVDRNIVEQDMYDDVMAWEANNFGSVIGNQGYFQNGIIHETVDEGRFFWRMEDDNGT